MKHREFTQLEKYLLTKTRHTCTYLLSSLLIFCSPTKVAGNGTDQALWVTQNLAHKITLIHQPGNQSFVDKIFD